MIMSMRLYNKKTTVIKLLVCCDLNSTVQKRISNITEVICVAYTIVRAQ